jgi:hypothetical protein
VEINPRHGERYQEKVKYTKDPEDYIQPSEHPPIGLACEAYTVDMARNNFNEMGKAIGKKAAAADWWYNFVMGIFIGIGFVFLGFIIRIIARS